MSPRRRRTRSPLAGDYPDLQVFPILLPLAPPGASVMPLIPNAHPNATVLAIAEKAAALMSHRR